MLNNANDANTTQAIGSNDQKTLVGDVGVGVPSPNEHDVSCTRRVKLHRF